MNVTNILSDKYIYIQSERNYSNLINELITLLNDTLCKLENVYFKYFLYPKLQNIGSYT